MSRNLLTSYSEYDAAIERILSLAERQIDIFDPDLSLLKLNLASRHEALTRLLSAPNHILRIVVLNSKPVMSQQPRLLKLLETHGHHFTLTEAGESLQHLTDAMILADGSHALIRFHREQPRGKLLENEADEVKPYERRFLSILEEGGNPITPRIAGL